MREKKEESEMLPRIVYMGTPEFAVAPLRQLHEAGYPIALVVTVPDKPAGRGLKLHCSAVKEYAVAQGLPLAQPANLKEESFLETLRAAKPDIGVVVAFRKLPKVVYSLPPMGFFNLHASLLPQYRGAAPINWAIMNGDAESGVTTFLLSDEIDAGQILLQAHCAITPNMTAGELHDTLMALGAPLVEKSVAGLAAGTLQGQHQAEAGVLRPAPKIFREDCKVDWTRPAAEVHNFIRGLAPYPGAWARFQLGEREEEAKLFDSFLWEGAAKVTMGAAAGSVGIPPDRCSLGVRCGDGGVVYLSSIQPAGRRRMTVHDYLLGVRG